MLHLPAKVFAPGGAGIRRNGCLTLRQHQTSSVSAGSQRPSQEGCWYPRSSPLKFGLCPQLLLSTLWEISSDEVHSWTIQVWSKESTPHPIPEQCLVPGSQNHSQHLCLVEILPLVKKRANSAAGKVCLSNSKERFASSANTDGNRKGKGWSGLSTRRGVFGVGLSAKCCCCASSLSLEYRAACKNFCRFAACERWDCGDLIIYKQGEIALVSKTSS